MGVIGNADISEDNTEAIVRIVPDLVGSRRASTAIIECDITESGMGTRSNACKIVAEVLNVPVEKVSITEPGSKFNPSNYGLCGSRGTITTGKAVSLAAMEAKKKPWSWAPFTLSAPLTSWTQRTLWSMCGITRSW